MTITAKIIADSICDTRLTTMQLRYPRFIHAEFMTHRVFSRNASSSRAVPVKRLIQDVLDDPAMPMHWGKNQKGMQAREEHHVPVYPVIGDPHWGAIHHGPKTREETWLMARDLAISTARAFDTAGYHKQIVNRLLEPFSHINVVVSSTEWDNFFKLRCHPDAQPEIRMLAEAMRDALNASTPEHLEEWEWHLPYIIDGSEDVELLCKVSAARCARVSYVTRDGHHSTFEEDLELFDRLTANDPMHLSPTEHQATPEVLGNTNFVGWMQQRWLLENTP